MLNKIKKEKANSDYFYDNYRFTKVFFFKEYMNTKSVELINLEFYPLFDKDITEDSIKEFYSEYIDNNWKINLDNFENKYSEFVEPILYADFLILLKFDKKKYVNFFKIKKGPYSFVSDRLFAPFILKLHLRYTNFEDQKIETKVEFSFRYYSDDALTIDKFDSKDLIIEEPYTFHDYVLVLPEDTNNKKKK